MASLLSGSTRPPALQNYLPPWLARYPTPTPLPSLHHAPRGSQPPEPSESLGNPQRQPPSRASATAPAGLPRLCLSCSQHRRCPGPAPAHFLPSLPLTVAPWTQGCVSFTPSGVPGTQRAPKLHLLINRLGPRGSVTHVSPVSQDGRGWESLWRSGLPSPGLPAGHAPVSKPGFSCHCGCGRRIGSTQKGSGQKGSGCQMLSTELKVCPWEGQRNEPGPSQMPRQRKPKETRTPD